uniref:hypothetical protein n=1 Tax=uncultured Acinetobacter sp. TaxID=165433 RepID=UPI0026036368
MQKAEESILHNLKINDWLESLRNYYLRTDGPYGTTKLTSLDVTPAGLAAAVDAVDCCDEVVLKAFMALFSRSSVQKILGTKIHESSGLYAYKNFHYLVLSCVAAATTTNAGDSNQYRERLGALLNDGKGAEQKVDGVNSLWKALAIWINKKDDSYRKIVLPEPGSWTLIGYAAKLAYPSRKDRADLKKILKELPDKALDNQNILLNYLKSWSYRLSECMRDDLADLIRCYGNNQSLETHHFWHLIETILVEISRESPRHFTLLWSISVSFGGWDGDELDEVFISKGNRRSDLENPFWHGTFSQLLKEHRTPPQIKKLLDSGCIILCESYGGLWTQDDRKPKEKQKAIILSCSEKIVRNFKKSLKLGHRWYCSETMSFNSALQITAGKGISDSNHQNTQLRIEGGISLGRGKWLSRPGYLPNIHLESNTELTTSPELKLEMMGNIAKIIEPITEGKWRIDQKQKNNQVAFKLVQFLKNAPLIMKWPERSDRYEAAVELSYEDGIPLNNSEIALSSSANFPNRLCDALEALYARAGVPRSETEIIKILKTVLPDASKLKYLVWDVIRSLEEAGWLEQDIKRSWRGRVWRVLPPRLVATGENIALVEGAIATAEFDSLKVEAEKIGINVYVNATSPFSAPAVSLIGTELQALAEKLGWSFVIARMPVMETAPICWPLENRTDMGRKLAGVWKADPGLFASEPQQQLNGPILSRLVREDDRDVFLIKDKSTTFISTQRTVALLEYARRTNTAL